MFSTSVFSLYESSVNLSFKVSVSGLNVEPSDASGGFTLFFPQKFHAFVENISK